VSAARPVRARPERDPLALPPHHFAQTWLLIVAFALLALAVLQQRGLLGLLFTLDRSHVTGVIAALVAFGTAHALWHLLIDSRRIEVASAALEGRIDGPASDPFVAAWQSAAAPGASAAQGHDDPLDHYADRLRGPAELGWFLVDTAVRLGLLGTIVGFILIFTSLSSVSIDGADGLRDLLVAMSGGMGTALLTTLAGLVGATLLAVQYLILGRQAEHLLGVLSRLRARVTARATARATARTSTQAAVHAGAAATARAGLPDASRDASRDTSRGTAR